MSIQLALNDAISILKTKNQIIMTLDSVDIDYYKKRLPKEYKRKLFELKAASRPTIKKFFEGIEVRDQQAIRIMEGCLRLIIYDYLIKKEEKREVFTGLL